jgi:cleavage and polyadenylation specificity factor subunit 1
MTLLPRTKAPATLPASPSAADNSTDAVLEHEILISDNTGTISLLTPLSEAQYRRLNTLASHLTNTLFHACGLNPRAYRAGKEAPDGMVGGGRTVVDGGMVLRWLELGTQRRSEVAGRVGMDSEEVREDLVALASGLGYL